MVMRALSRCSTPLFLDVKWETLAPTLFNQPSFPFQLRDPFVRIFFRHAAFLHRSILDRTLDAKRHFVRRPGKRGVLSINNSTITEPVGTLRYRPKRL